MPPHILFNIVLCFTSQIKQGANGHLSTITQDLLRILVYAFFKLNSAVRQNLKYGNDFHLPT